MICGSALSLLLINSANVPLPNSSWRRPKKKKRKKKADTLTLNFETDIVYRGKQRNQIFLIISIWYKPEVIQGSAD